MVQLTILWVASAGLTWLIATSVSYAMEGRLLRGTWVVLGMTIMSVLGPIGTALTIGFLAKLVVFTLRETRRAQRPNHGLRLRPIRS